MDKRNLKKVDQLRPEKDRGDNLKKIERTVRKALDLADEVKGKHPGGDTERKLPKTDKPRIIVFKKPEDVKLKIVEHGSKDNDSKKEKVDETLNKIDRDERRRVRERYTLKQKVPSVVGAVVKKEDSNKLNLRVPVEVKSDRTQKGLGDHKIRIESSTESGASEHKQENRKDRRPIIKTVVAKNDSTKVFKAVTFVDHKKAKPTMLQIKIPSDVKNTKISKAVETNNFMKRKATASKTSVDDKPVGIRKEDRKKSKQRHVLSPDLSVRVKSPPTEVAKWAPSSINRHTKPYYEAWVSTTLAAISKNSKKDKLFLEKQNILQSFQRALAERPGTPELVYENCLDERYTGKIKVRQR